MLFRMRVIRRLLCVVGVGIFAVGVCCAARSGCEGDIAVSVDAVAVPVVMCTLYSSSMNGARESE